MSSCQLKKLALLEASRHHSTPSSTLNTTEISLNNANLENYKKALHNIVRRLNKTPSISNKVPLKRSESKLNQSHQTMYQTSTYTQYSSSKKHHVSSNSISKNQSVPKRSQSNESSAYKITKDLLNKSMQEPPYMRKESLSSNMLKSISTQKYEKTDPHELEYIVEENILKGSNSTQGNVLTTNVLQEVSINNFDLDGDKSMKDLLHKFQLRDAVHRQEITKLKKPNDLLRAHVKELEKEIDRSNQKKDLEKKYTLKLENELSNLKEKMRAESTDKKSSSQSSFENKENKYLKVIEDLKSQLNTVNSEKKMVENLLKNTLLQNETSKENKKDRKASNSVLLSMDNGRTTATSSKQVSLGGRVKTDNFMKKKPETEAFDTENDYSSHAASQLLNGSFVALPSKISQDEKPREMRDTNASINFEKLTKLIDGNTITTLITDESDEPYPNKVSPPKLNNKSLKERLDMNVFKLDLTRLSKNRKID